MAPRPPKDEKARNPTTTTTKTKNHSKKKAWDAIEDAIFSQLGANMHPR